MAWWTHRLPAKVGTATTHPYATLYVCRYATFTICVKLLHAAGSGIYKLTRFLEYRLDFFSDHSNWQGFPGDLAWNMEHCYGFLGDARPLAFNSEATLVKAGGLYLILDDIYDDQNGVLVFENGVTLVDIVRGFSAEASYPPCRRTNNVKKSADDQNEWYKTTWMKENAIFRKKSMGRPEGKGRVS